jgi:hypothetical protein
MTEKKTGATDVAVVKDWSKASLLLKMAEIHKRVSFLKKDQQGFNFKYVASSQVLLSIRDVMDEVGVLLVPSIETVEVKDHTNQKGKHEYFTQVWFVMEWRNIHDSNDKIIVKWYAQGLDDGEKGPGIAETYAEKMLILKTFNIATDELDPDRICNDKDHPRNRAANREPEIREESSGSAEPEAGQAVQPKLPPHISLVMADEGAASLIEAYRVAQNLTKKEMGVKLKEVYDQNKSKGGTDAGYLEVVKKHFDDNIPF